MKFYNTFAALQLTSFLLSASLVQSQLQWETQEDEKNICFLMYSMADNNLEIALREDLQELVQSPVINDPSLTTWIYFDQRNLQDTPYETGGPIIEDSPPFLFQASGAPAPRDKFEGSSYLRYDQDLKKLVIDTQLEGEKDGDDVQTPYDFLMHALPDCVAKGATEYIMIFSSHGGGFKGFGGDENMATTEEVTARNGNPDFDGRRKLLIRNQYLVNAIYYALEDVEGAPEKLDVIGFDACLMSAIGAIDEYRDIANYVLASEAIEPGHGWAYDKLDTTESALAMAESLAFHFLNTTQAMTEWYPDVHETPKTIAVVDTADFTVFHQAWEELLGEFVTLLNTSITNDPYLHSAVTRARAATLAFVSIDGDRSAADIGHFLENFMDICNVDTDSTLYDLWTRALETYNDQFVARGVGNGTSTDATGMHVFWPLKDKYQMYPDYYNDYIFWDYLNDDTPNWTNFVWAYFDWTAPTESDGSSVCLNSLKSDIEPTFEGQLLLDPTLSFDTDSGNAIVSSDVTVETDWVFVEYGLNLNHILDNRRLQEKASKSQPPPDDSANGHRSMRNRRLGQRERRMQDESEDYYYMYYGDAAVHFNGPTATAEWDREFHFLSTPESSESIYVFDYGGGTKSFPVCYFTPDNLRSREEFEAFLTVQEAMETMGCIEGEIFFSIYEGLGTTYSLYTYSNVTGVQSEVPRTAGGMIVPIAYMDLAIGETIFKESVGGFNSTVVYWNPTNGMDIFTLPDTVVMDLFGTETADLSIHATDYDETNPDFGYDVQYFAYTLDDVPTETTDDPSEVSKSGLGRRLRKA